MMELAWLGVVAPGLRNAERGLVLRGVDGLEVVGNRCLNKLLNTLKFRVLQDRVIDASSVAHVITRLLVLDKRNFCLSEVSTEVKHT